MTTSKPAPSASLADRLRQGRLTRPAPDQPARAATWSLVKVALLVPVVSIVLLAVIITATKLLAGGAFGGLGTETAAGWLVLNQVPLTVGGVTVGALPLLPPMGLIAAVVVVTSRAARRVGTLSEVASIAGAALAGPLLVTAIALAVVADGAAVSSIGQAAPLPAFAHTLLVQLIGVAIAVGGRCLQPLVDHYEFPVTDRVGGRAGLIAVAGLIAAGALIVSLAFVFKWHRVGDLIAGGHSIDGYLGLTVLSILYLPNVVITAAAIAVGAQAQFGSATVDALGVQPGTAPPLPILGLLPESSVGTLGVIVFVLPLAVGVLVGWFCRSVDPLKHLRAVGVAAAVAAALVVLGTFMASGSAGELGSFGAAPALAGVYTFAWIAVVGAVVAGIYALLPGNRAQRSTEPFDLDSLLESDMFDDLEIIDPDALDIDPEAPTEVLDAVVDDEPEDEPADEAEDAAPGDAR